MKALARALEKLDCTVGLVLPEGEGGYDIADAIAEGGYKAVKAWVEGLWNPNLARVGTPPQELP